MIALVCLPGFGYASPEVWLIDVDFHCSSTFLLDVLSPSNVSPTLELSFHSCFKCCLLQSIYQLDLRYSYLFVIPAFSIFYSSLHFTYLASLRYYSNPHLPTWNVSQVFISVLVSIDSTWAHWIWSTHERGSEKPQQYVRWWIHKPYISILRSQSYMWNCGH